MIAGRDKEKHAAGCRRLWAFDFDGTLSLLVPDRNAARLHPASRSLLKYLAADPRNLVAVLSSRSLEDLSSRVPVPGLFLGGGSGLEWRFPAGRRISPGEEAERRLKKARRAVSTALTRLSAFPGVELEDKKWSAAVHFRRVLPEALSMLYPLLRELKSHPGIRTFEGPSVAEVQFFPSVNKSFGMRRLCRMLKFDPTGGRILYAGDDENDALAMKWAISNGGIAMAVGSRVRVKGIRTVEGPAELAETVRELAGPRGEGRPAAAGRGETC